MLADYRKRTNRTQWQLAQEVGCSKSMIAQVEIAERQPSRELLAKLCQVLRLSAEETALLYFEYGWLPPIQQEEGYLPCIRAAIRRDTRLFEVQKENLIRQVETAYYAATQVTTRLQNGK